MPTRLVDGPSSWILALMTCFRRNLKNRGSNGVRDALGVVSTAFWSWQIRVSVYLPRALAFCVFVAGFPPNLHDFIVEIMQMICMAGPLDLYIRFTLVKSLSVPDDWRIGSHVLVDFDVSGLVMECICDDCVWTSAETSFVFTIIWRAFLAVSMPPNMPRLQANKSHLFQ